MRRPSGFSPARLGGTCALASVRRQGKEIHTQFLALASIWRRCIDHGPQTNEALPIPHARGRRGRAEHRLHINRDRATRRNPSRAAKAEHSGSGARAEGCCSRAAGGGGSGAVPAGRCSRAAGGGGSGAVAGRRAGSRADTGSASRAAAATVKRGRQRFAAAGAASHASAAGADLSGVWRVLTRRLRHWLCVSQPPIRTSRSLSTDRSASCR
jgi:hypothetical protein